MREQPLYRRLADLAARARVPATVHLELTRRCNERCVHCNIPEYRDRRPLTRAEFERLFDQLRRAGTMFVTFTGGEATLHPEFRVIVAAARVRRLACALNTNATVVDDDLAAFLAGQDLDRVQVSLYGADAEAHEAVTRRPGSYAATWRGLHALARHGVRVRIAFHALAATLAHADDVRRQAEVLGAAVTTATRVFPRTAADAANTEFRSSLGEEARLRAARRPPPAADPSARSGPALRDRILSMNLCGAGVTFAYLDANGNLSACAEFDHAIGNVRDAPFDVLWREATMLRTLRDARIGDLEICAACEALAWCDRCPGEAFKHTGSFLGIDPNACERAFALRAATLGLEPEQAAPPPRLRELIARFRGPGAGCTGCSERACSA